jgi:hypothetical protein
VTRARFLLSLVGVVLIVLPAAYAGPTPSPSRYSASATYACLKKRPELRPFGWEPGLSKIPPPKSGLALILLSHPLRFARADVPDLHVRASSPGSWLPLEFYVPHRGDLPLDPTILIFDQTAAARKAYLDFFHGPQWKGVLPWVVTRAKNAYVQRGNAIIDFMVFHQDAPKQYRSIILGCLRTR